MTVAGLGFLIFAIMLAFAAIIEIKNESVNWKYSLVYAAIAACAGLYLLGSVTEIY